MTDEHSVKPETVPLCTSPVAYTEPYSTASV